MKYRYRSIKEINDYHKIREVKNYKMKFAEVHLSKFHFVMPQTRQPTSDVSGPKFTIL